jgi:hypothetical protein
MRVAATALIAAGVLAGCTETTSGSVAMTTEPGPPLTTTTTPPDDTPTALPGLPGLPEIPSLPQIPGMPQLPGMPGNAPEVPPPPNATTMTCQEYMGLDDSTKQAVLRAIIAEEGPNAPFQEPWLAQMLTDGMCQLIPKNPVRDALLGPTGGGPP